jgi:hypothetical protein
MIEQQVGRGAWESSDELNSDEAIRLRDGYALVLESQVRDTLPCKKCGQGLTVPVNKTGEMVCQRCTILYGKPTRMFAGYYPLCESLLQALERTSPKRDGAWAREMKESNDRLRRSKQRDYDNYGEAVIKDYFPRIADIPQVGYGGSITSKVH